MHSRERLLVVDQLVVRKHRQHRRKADSPARLLRKPRFVKESGKEVSPLPHLFIVNLGDELFNAPYIDSTSGPADHEQVAGGAGYRVRYSITKQIGDTVLDRVQADFEYAGQTLRMSSQPRSKRLLTAKKLMKSLRLM